MGVKPRVFTLEEAGALLPELQRRLSDLFNKRQTYLQKHDMLFMQELLNHAERSSAPSTSDPLELEKEIQELETAIGALENDVREIHALGCIIRDLETGRIDFLGKKDDEMIYYCWKWGDKDIHYYYPVGGKFSERRSLVAENK